MKKIYLSLVMAMIAIAANAQSEPYYGAKEGGFAFSFNANPMLNYLGNMFNGTQNNSLRDFSGLGNNLFRGITITGKYMYMDNISLDLGFGFDNNYATTNNYKGSEGENYEKESSIKEVKDNSFMIKLGASYLLRPGQRIQPIIGAGLVYCHSNYSTYNQLKNSDYSNKNLYSYPENKLGIIANVGVEYFLFKQVSLGATVDFGAHHTWESSSYEKKGYSENNGDGHRVNNESTKIVTGHYGGNLSLNFYF